MSIMFMKKLSLFFVAICISVATFAQFSGSGSGTKDDPYLIFNPIQLDQVRNFVGKYVYFKLMTDIDLTEFIADNYPTEGWLPIGNSNKSAYFSGEFDGNGKTISGLWINRPQTDNVGLFGYVAGSTTSIKNLTLKDANIKGRSSVGGVVGYGSGFSMDSVTFSGNVIGNYGNVGGIIGNANYSCSFTNIIVYGEIAGSDEVGGIAGYAYEGLTIKRCMSFVKLLSSGNYCGGICGHAYSGSLETNYSHCKITSNGNYIGGIVGYAKGDIYDNYTTGTLVSKNGKMGGICGYLEGSNKKITSYPYYSYSYCERNYSLVSIIGGDSIGGIVGMFDGREGTYAGETYKYYSYIYSNVVMCPQIKGKGEYIGKIYGYEYGSGRYTYVGSVGTTETNKALTTTKIIVDGVEQGSTGDNEQNGQSAGKTVLQYKAAYMGIGWNFTDVWDIQETESFPYLSFQCAPPTLDVATAISGSTMLSGQGKDGATIIVQVGDKQYQTPCSNNVWTLSLPALVAGTEIEVYAVSDDKRPSYVISAVVSYLGTGTEGDPWQIHTAEELSNISGNGYFQLMNDIDLSAIANWTPLGATNSISGDFDGKNHTIKGLNINSTDENMGLFGTCNGLNIHDLNIEVKKIAGGKNTAALAARLLNATITNCHVKGGSIKGGGNVGALVAIAQDCTIEGCSTKNNITSGDLVGGIAGSASGSISQCFTEGILISSASGSVVGGLVGSNQATVNDCYSTATIKANDYAGGLIGYNYGAVSNCYATGDLSSTNHAGGLVGYNDGTAATTKNSCAMNSKIDVSSAKGSAIRVIGGIKNSAPTPDMNNYALKTMAVSINNIPQKIYDDNLNGVTKTDAELKQESFYFLLEWDMDETWNIREGETYPLLTRFMSEPVVRSLHLSDDNTIYRAGTYIGGLDYTRNISGEDKYASFCLPFGVNADNNASALAKLYTPLGIAFQYRNSQDQEVMKVFFVSTDSIAAGNPFVAQLGTGLGSAITVVANTDSIAAGVIGSTDIIYPYEYNSAEVGNQASIPMNGHLAFGGALATVNIQDAMVLQPNGEFSAANTQDIAPFYTYLVISNQLLSKCQKVIAFVSDNSDIPSFIEDLQDETGNNQINVYTLDGKCIMQNISKEEALQILEKGIYLFNKEKIAIQ